MSRKILVTAVKNEAPFLIEWVAYHRIIGFDEILVVSNDSDDGTTFRREGASDAAFRAPLGSVGAEGDASANATRLMSNLTLPQPEAMHLAKEDLRHDVILEHGTGESTIAGAAPEHSLIVSVEYDRTWAKNIRAVPARDFPHRNVVVHRDHDGIAGIRTAVTPRTAPAVAAGEYCLAARHRTAVLTP